MVADISDTKLPAIMALKPSSVSSFLVLGAMIPIPPTWIPMEAKLAKIDQKVKKKAGKFDQLRGFNTKF
mgnify:CR=1 FL=1